MMMFPTFQMFPDCSYVSGQIVISTLPVWSPTAAARAVGRVMATNPLPFIVSCHRVVAATAPFTATAVAST